MKRKIRKILLLLTSIIIFPTSIYANTNNCPFSEDIHMIANKTTPLSEDFKPTDLVVPNVKFAFSGIQEKSYLRKEAAKALEDLFNQAKTESIHLAAVSGFRSYERQSQIYSRNVKNQGEAQANRVSAKPGQSEHQTGLVMDVSAASVDYALVQSFADTKEGKWLASNAHKYGFVIRYPKNKEHITGYIYEPWHIRYVGKELAHYLYTNSLTLEELDNCCLPINQIEQFSLYINGYLQTLPNDFKALLDSESNILVPLRTTALKLGHHVLWEESLNSAFILPQNIEIPNPLIIFSTSYVPIRSLTDMLGYTIEYKNQFNNISINIVKQ